MFIFLKHEFMNLLLLAIFTVVSLQCNAQKEETPLSEGRYECLYEYNVSSQNGNVDKYFTILQIGSSSARFVDYTQYEVDSVFFLKMLLQKTRKNIIFS